MVENQTLKEYVNEIIADGFIDEEEYLRLMRWIIADETINKEDHEQLNRIQALRESGELKLFTDDSSGSLSKVTTKMLIYAGCTLLFLVSLILIISQNFQWQALRDEKLHLALLGPISGPKESDGKLMAKTAQLMIDNLNKSGGINGKFVELSVFDDTNDPREALRISKIISADQKTLMVISHQSNWSASSSSKIFHDANIPVISSITNDLDIVRDNDSFFNLPICNTDLAKYVHNCRSESSQKFFQIRTSVQREAEFIAFYLHHVLKKRIVSIIYENEQYGEKFAGYFQDKFENHLLDSVKYKWSFESDAKEDQLDQLVLDLSLAENPGVIIIAAHPQSAARILVKIKEAGLTNMIFGGSLLNNEMFISEIIDLVGDDALALFTDQIYAVSDTLFEMVNQAGSRFAQEFEKHYGSALKNISGNHYDALALGIEALKSIDNSEIDLPKMREGLLAYLSKFLDFRYPYEGIGGDIFFDQKGASIKPLQIGIFEKGQLLPNNTQLHPIFENRLIPDLADAIQHEQVYIDAPYDYSLVTYYRRKDLVFTGIELNRLVAWDQEKRTFDLDFWLWFRYVGDKKIQDIVFPNALSSILLDKPYKKLKSSESNYLRYRILGKFQETPTLFGHHNLGFSFRNRKLTDDMVFYVPDMFGMGTSQDTPLSEMIKRKGVFDKWTDWNIRSAGFSQDLMESSSYGDPKQLSSMGPRLNFSSLNFDLDIHSSKQTIHRILSFPVAFNLSLICLLLFAIYIAHKVSKKVWFNSLNFDLDIHSSWINWSIEVLIISCLLFCSEVLAMEWFVHSSASIRVILVQHVFNSLWWLACASFINTALFYFIWIPLEKKVGKPVPDIAKYFIVCIVYLFAFFGIVGFVFNYPLTGLLASSGLAAMIIGLSLQISLNNIIAGISINIDRPFHIGDWVQIASYDEGKVMKIGWRSTRIKTRDQCMVSIPNSDAAESFIKNYTYPNNTVERWFFVSVDPVHDPEHVKKLMLDAAMTTEGVSKDPGPYIRFKGMNDHASSYGVYHCILDYAKKFAVEEALWKNLWVSLNNAGIQPVIQRQQISILDSEKEKKELAPVEVESLKHQIELLTALPKAMRDQALANLEMIEYNSGQVVIQQGDKLSESYFIVEGVVKLTADLENDQIMELDRLGAGQSMGITGLLTGKPYACTAVSITTTKVYKINRRIIAEFIKEDPELIVSFSRLLMNRKLEHLPNQMVPGKENLEIMRYKKEIEEHFQIVGRS